MIGGEDYGRHAGALGRVSGLLLGVRCWGYTDVRRAQRPLRPGSISADIRRLSCLGDAATAVAWAIVETLTIKTYSDGSLG